MKYITTKENVGKCCRLHAACDEWMQGDRTGRIVGIGRARTYIDAVTGEENQVRPYRVKLDVSGRIRRFHPENLFIDGGIDSTKR